MDFKSNSFSSIDICESEDELEEDPWKILLNNITQYYLESLRIIFKAKCENSIEKGLNKEEFINAISEVFGNEKYTSVALVLFKEINTTESNKITWNQFLDYLIEPKEIKTQEKVQFCEPKIFVVPHIKRETIKKIVLIETNKYFCYAIISKYGRVGVYDGNMNFLTSYHALFGREDIYRSDKERRRRNRWITDACFIAEFCVFIVANSARSIVIYDASGLNHVPMWLILGLPNIVMSLTFKSGEHGNRCLLYLGEDTGAITSLKFLQPKVGLLRKKHNDKLTLFYWIELQDEKNYVNIKYNTIRHRDSIKLLEYLPESDFLISCSRDSECSVVIGHTKIKRVPYIIKTRSGVSCFSFSKKLNLIVTGSDDGTIKIWNYIMTTRPLVTLKKHLSGVVDVVIFENQRLFLSCSRDAVLNVWDIDSYKCLVSMKIKYPPFKILGRAIEWGIRSIYPGPKRYPLVENKFEVKEEKVMLNSRLEVNKIKNNQKNNVVLSKILDLWERSNILVTCCNFLAQINLSFFDTEIVNTFEMPVLPPTPLQNSVLIPADWSLCDRNIEFSECKEYGENVERQLSELSFILDKDLLKDDLKSDINYKIARLERQKKEMKNMVMECAPFLALKLHDIETVRIDSDLVVPSISNVKYIVEKTHRMLSSATSRSQVFSESSNSKSTRSSIVEFDN